MDDAQTLLQQIEDTCRRLKMAQTTFGRLAVNDGKFVSRLQQGGRTTIQTVERVHRFIEAQGGESATTLRSAIKGLRAPSPPREEFRFYGNRQKYLMFVNTTSEKQRIADRAVAEMAETQPRSPAIRFLDGGSGDGTALSRILRGMHRQRPHVPIYVVAKEISMENVRLALEKMPDRLQEHPETVLVMTNLKYGETPSLQPENPNAASAMVWQEVALEGATAGDFEEQIAQLDPFLEKYWQATISNASGNPLYKTPVVLILYRRDHRFLLEQVIPRRGYAEAEFDFILLSQPYRARAPMEFKTSKIVTPLVRALRPNGRLMGVQSHGDNPGMEIIRSIWPGEDPFIHSTGDIMQSVAEELGIHARDYRFHDLPDDKRFFQYDVRTLPTEINDPGAIGSSTVFAAWNAASYVAQIDDARLSQVIGNDAYLEQTHSVLLKHQKLWFNDEIFVISKTPQV